MCRRHPSYRRRQKYKDKMYTRVVKLRWTPSLTQTVLNWNEQRCQDLCSFRGPSLREVWWRELHQSSCSLEESQTAALSPNARETRSESARLSGSASKCNRHLFGPFSSLLAGVAELRWANWWHNLPGGGNKVHEYILLLIHKHRQIMFHRHFGLLGAKFHLWFDATVVRFWLYFDTSCPFLYLPSFTWNGMWIFQENYKPRILIRCDLS